MKQNFSKQLLAIVIICFFVLFGLNSASFAYGYGVCSYLRQEMQKTCGVNADVDTYSLEAVERAFDDSLWKKQDLIGFSGFVAKILNMKNLYDDANIYSLEDGYLISRYGKTTTDYEYEQLIAFQEYLDEMDVNLIYVNYPAKYLNDSIFAENFGVESYVNQNADLLLERISDAGINYIDLRECMVEDGWDIYDMFYYSDHHWTTKAGLWAAEIIAKGLNSYGDYEIDTSVYDSSNFIFTEYQKCWLGEQGRKTGALYTKLDDFTVIVPDFATDYLFKYGNDWAEGTFDNFIAWDTYTFDQDIYTVNSWHYSYFQTPVINKSIQGGKILALGDSYNQVVIPFLSLAVREIDVVILRDSSFEGSIREYIEAGDYDTVLICYSAPTIGGHDDETSVNHKLFTFE